MQRFLFSFLFCALAQQAVHSDSAVPAPLAPPAKKPYPYGRQPAPKPVEIKEEPDCVKTPHTFRFSLSHQEGGGLGYTQGYTSLDGFFIFNCMESWHPFFDVRAHIFNNGRPAANLGFGLRYVPDFPVVLGINGFFDYTNTKHTTFEQAGFGVEALGTKWALRANGYLPLFSKNNLYSLDFYKFQGHHAIFRANHEISFKGFDVGLSRILIQGKNCDLSSTLGGYMFFADYDSKASGGLVKLKTNLTPFWSLESQFSYDSYFKAILQAQAAVNIPFGKRAKTGRRKKLPCRQEVALARRIVEPVDRFEIIVADHHPIDSVARDIRTNDPLHIVFVDNRNINGNGTAESPYGFLKQAENHSSPGDMIYVYAGDGSENGINAGVILKNDQWLQSSYLPFATRTEFGINFVPRQTNTRPIITSATSSAVVLANNNTVTGFAFHSNTTNISGALIKDLRLVDNKLSVSADFDITLNDVSGTIVLQDNVSTGSSGLYLHTNLDTRLVLTGNDFANTGDFNMDIAFRDSSNSTVLITNRNEAHDSLSGTLITTHNTAHLDTYIANNAFTAIPDGTPYCLKILTSENSTAVVVVENNLFRSSAPALHLDTDLAGVAEWFVIGNEGLYTGHDSPIYPYAFTTNGTSTATLLLTRNFSAADGYALDNLSGTATFNAQSPTGSITGLENLNIGTFTTSGIITYIPYNPASIPVID